MVQFSTFLLALSAAGSVTAAPTHLSKRIAQVISDSTRQWEAACDKAGGQQQCNAIAVKAFGTLLAGAGPCDQQDNADNMMDLSKQLGSTAMINLAQIFVQQPRNTPDSLSVQYCQKAPRNAELTGLFQCQFQGANPNKFTGGIQAGAPGTIPFGDTAVLNPPGSCPAHLSGPIPDGTQLVDQVSSPGIPSSNGAGSGNPATPSSAPPQSSSSPAPTAPSAAPTTPSSPASTPVPSSGSSGFLVQNGKDARALNQKFQTLTADSPCKDGEDACVGGQFGQCASGKFTLTACSAPNTCVALPLQNRRGTSVTCDSQSDADTRIAAALASGSK
ncbi:hypothetical protein BJV78DRAFT_1276354 [Lactifluus subvellereus]|nr:hypothetical protein BJV78DRAFT_1276354 [Lactifluus subvellereus]